jgi:hypothetical protein
MEARKNTPLYDTVPCLRSVFPYGALQAANSPLSFLSSTYDSSVHLGLRTDSLPQQAKQTKQLTAQKEAHSKLLLYLGLSLIHAQLTLFRHKWSAPHQPQYPDPSRRGQWTSPKPNASPNPGKKSRKAKSHGRRSQETRRKTNRARQGDGRDPGFQEGVHGGEQDFWV